MAEISILSRQLVQPSTLTNKTDRNEIIHLSTWDLPYLCFDYMQIGLLFSKPDELIFDKTISVLKVSLSKTLGYFYPFAGRLSTTNYDDDTLSICIACNDKGAEFVRASALDVAVSGVLTDDHYLPDIVHSFFPIKDVVGHDGHTLPLLAVQITELKDGVFIGCSLNHVASDGTSLWHFIRTWSKISCNQTVMDMPSILDRYFLESYPPPVRIPYKKAEDFIRRPKIDHCNRAQCFLHFTADMVKKLKAMANDEMGYEQGEISSLQALSAHAWIAISRARRLPPEQVIANVVVVGYRSRFPKSRPIPQTYLGNAVGIATAINKAREITENGIGWVASKLKEAILKMEDEVVVNQVHSWVKEPSFPCIGNDNGFFVVTTGGQRFDMYGNDFGWGSPLAIRRGGWNKAEGMIAVYPGKVAGSIDLNIFLATDTAKALLGNRAFMETVG